jgi:regulatory protein
MNKRKDPPDLSALEGLNIHRGIAPDFSSEGKSGSFVEGENDSQGPEDKQGAIEEENPDSDGGRASRKAEARAMKLLLCHMMTVREMRERLIKEGFADGPVEDAIEYCSSFGYLNDERYAENYIISMRPKKSAAMIRRELENKGVSAENIETAFEENPYDESEIIYNLVRKKDGEPHRLDDRELRRTYAFLARKGFGSSEIWKAIHRFQDEAV